MAFRKSNSVIQVVDEKAKRKTPPSPHDITTLLAEDKLEEMHGWDHDLENSGQLDILQFRGDAMPCYPTCRSLSKTQHCLGSADTVLRLEC